MVGGFVEEQGRTGTSARGRSCRRIRQPPEKLFTGWDSRHLEAEAEDQAWARASASWAPASWSSM